MSVVQNEILELLAQADLLLLVASLIDRPGQPVIDQWSTGPADITELLQASGFPDPESTAEVISRVSDTVANTDVTKWSDEHCRLFEAAVVCPINESAYIRRDKGAILSDICGFYNAFGFSLDTEIGEKADHLVCEIQFFALLLVMTSEALRQGSKEKSQVTRDAATSFAKDHFGEWVLAFCDRLGQSTTLEIYQHAALVLAMIYNAICNRHGISLHDPLAILEPQPDAGTPYECGMAEGCGAGAECGLPDGAA